MAKGNRDRFAAFSLLLRMVSSLMGDFDPHLFGIMRRAMMVSSADNIEFDPKSFSNPAEVDKPAAPGCVSTN